MEVTFKIFRFDPKLENSPHYDTFKVEASPNDRLLDCLNKIRWEKDPSLAYRMSCAHGICGSDGMTVNGVAALACQKLVKDFVGSEEIMIEPLRFFPVIKDLVVDMELFFQRQKDVHPMNIEGMIDVKEARERLQSEAERAQFNEAIKCISCACCTASCPMNLRDDPKFIGPAAILRAQRYIFDSRLKSPLERMKVMDRPHGIWSCMSHFKCTYVCPKKIKVTRTILQTKVRILHELHPFNNEG